ncbi:hypothetical protein PCCS19_11320 [Paenibacillus sp. CCS19]|uniref:hypothetical protein n=1 Tax=Paenibacillus sp. CCS19 TaxID=3158387 RepID=UPI002566B074|nr:hypothetical protein [Paenibacillus cellulosilyticus]GMK38078.1 hypothetical protein PCCS19_11320 [Paenibacillus cellulosilyticus]
MGNLFTNKKKIRNWKRRVRNVHKWKKSYLHLDLEQLLKNEKTHLKIWIDPWYRLARRNPPHWLRKIMFEGLTEICLNWKKQLDELKEPYDLQIWLYDPNFINSEVVVAIRGSLESYNRTFNKASNIKDFPKEYYLSSQFLSELEWGHYLEEDYYFLTLDDLTDTEVDKLKNRAIVEEVIFNNGSSKDTCFRINKGDVWVATVKA